MLNRWWWCKQQQNKTQNKAQKAPWLVLSLSGVFLLTGCFHKGTLVQDASERLSTEAHASELVNKNLGKDNALPAETIKANTIPLKAGDMYQILVAEMMVLNGFEAQAFDIVFKVAHKLRSSDLAERAFQLSMKTYNAKKIEAATLLWREIEPEAIIPWQASFLIALRQNNVEQALNDWQHYRSLSKESLEQDLFIAAQKVGASSPPESGLLFLQKLVEQYPDIWASYFALGLVADGFNQFDVALVALEQAKVRQTEESEPQIHQFFLS